jgi:isopentenyldiphosphate isomerase
MSSLDEHKPGRPISLNRDENQYRVDSMIQESRRINQRDIVLKLGITRNQERVHRIIETLNYKKASASSIPKHLTDPMKEQETWCSITS